MAPISNDERAQREQTEREWAQHDAATAAQRTESFARAAAASRTPRDQLGPMTVMQPTWPEKGQKPLSKADLGPQYPAPSTAASVAAEKDAASRRKLSRPPVVPPSRGSLPTHPPAVPQSKTWPVMPAKPLAKAAAGPLYPAPVTATHLFPTRTQPSQEVQGPDASQGAATVSRMASAAVVTSAGLDESTLPSPVRALVEVAAAAEDGATKHPSEAVSSRLERFPELQGVEVPTGNAVRFPELSEQSEQVQPATTTQSEQDSGGYER